MRVWVLALLVVAGCGRSGGQAEQAENRPLHGSAEAIARHLGPVPHDSLLTVSESFGKYFEAVGALELSGEYLIRHLSRLAVGPDGRMLVQDRRSSEVILFAADGGLIAKLDPAACHPGHSGRLGSSGFFPDGSVLATASGDAHMIFDAAGQCVGPWDGPRYAHHTTVGPDGLIYQYFPITNNIQREARDRDGQLVHAWPVHREFPLLSERLRAGDLVVDTSGTAYMTLSIDGHPRVYRPGSEESILGQPPASFMAPTEDLPEVSGMEAVIEAMQSRRPSSGSVYLWKLDADRLMLGYVHPEPIGPGDDERAEFRVINMEGEPVHAEPIFYRFYLSGFVGAADGVLYRMLHPTGDDDNPTLVLYRFTG